MSDHRQTILEEPADPRDVRIVLNATAVLLAAIVCITFLQVVLRYVFGNPLSWGEELARYIFVWITFLGAAVAYARDTHIRVDAVIALSPPLFQRLAAIFRRAVEFIAIGVLFYSGVIVAWRYRSQSFYSLPDAPLVIFPLAIPVSALLMAYFFLRHLHVRRGREAAQP